MKKVTLLITLLIIGVVALASFVLIINQTEAPEDMSPRIDLSEQTVNLELLSESAVMLELDTNESAGIVKNTIMKASFNTNKGSFELELFPDLAPKTVENFATLAESDFYTGVKFHRIIEGFMIQGGDPLTKDDNQSDSWGTGGPGYTFADEIHAENKNVIGTISMANAGPNTNGSQFFINTADNNFLDTKHTVFGRLISGMEIISAIEKVNKFPNDRPVEAVVIESITIIKE
jgi:cyclophilin family peptidyl-prolyl cis-trans isomerase